MLDFQTLEDLTGWLTDPSSR
ncbi:hypothetical protein [Thermostichus vulcanus]